MPRRLAHPEASADRQAPLAGALACTFSPTNLVAICFVELQVAQSLAACSPLSEDLGMARERCLPSPLKVRKSRLHLDFARRRGLGTWTRPTACWSRWCRIDPTAFLAALFFLCFLLFFLALQGVRIFLVAFVVWCSGGGSHPTTNPIQVRVR